MRAHLTVFERKYIGTFSAISLFPFFLLIETMIAPTISGPDGLRHSIVYSLLYSDLTKGLIFSELQALQLHIVISTKNGLFVLHRLESGKIKIHQK